MRCVLASVFCLAIGLLPAAAPEHVHQLEDHGHAEVVIHRHMAPHGVVNRADHHNDDGHQTSLEDDAPILTLTSLYTVPGSLILASPERSASDLIEIPEAHSITHVLTKFDVPIHGPPRAPAGLRAPPFSPAS